MVVGGQAERVANSLGLHTCSRINKTNAHTQVASNYFHGYDRLLDVFHEIGSSLPQFSDRAEIFKGSDQMASYLGLFYAEIIEFHYQAMRFFRQTSITRCVIGR